jgi:hypothetical protein
MQTHAHTLSAKSFLGKKQISSVEMWKFRIKKQMCVRAGRCMRTMSRPRHVRRWEHNTPGPNISHAQASPLARHSFDANALRDARSWWPHQQHGIFVLGAHSYKQINSDAPSCRIIPQNKSTRRRHARGCCRDRARWQCLLAFWMMLFRDSNCTAIRHSEKVNIHEWRKEASKRPWCGCGCEWRTKKQPRLSRKTNWSKECTEMQLGETSR